MKARKTVWNVNEWCTTSSPACSFRNVSFIYLHLSSLHSMRLFCTYLLNIKPAFVARHTILCFLISIWRRSKLAIDNSPIFQGEVSDPDESQQFIFTRTRTNFNYDPSNLQSAIAVEEPIKVYNSGEVKSEITFNDDMKVCV